MAKHKKPTEVTLVPREEKSEFHDWVERNWKKGAFLAVLGTVAILTWKWYRDQQAATVDSAWQILEKEVSFTENEGISLPMAAAFGFPTGLTAPPPGEMAQLSAELEETAAGPWARLVEATKAIEAGDYEAAEDALQALESVYKDHPLVTQPRNFESGSTAVTPVEHLREMLERHSSFEENHPYLFRNPDPEPDAPRIRLNTTRGPITLDLYYKRAPEHSRNFLKLCKEGYYDDTKFHRIMADSIIQGGDPNPRDGEPSTWGQGGPEYKIAPETHEELSHFAWVLAAAKKPGDQESSGSQFYITVKPNHMWDGQYTVYGRLVPGEGEQVVEEIASGSVAADAADRPENPESIESVEIIRDWPTE